MHTRRLQLVAFFVGLVSFACVLGAVVGAGVKKRIQFTIPLRVGADQAPEYLAFQDGDDPQQVAIQFCKDIGADTQQCGNSVYTALLKRIKWQTENDEFAMTEHTEMLPVDYAYETPRFDANNELDLRHGIDFLNDQGYVVFKNVANKEEVSKAYSLLWDFLEEKFSAYRNNITSWDLIPSNEFGIILQFGIGQSDFMWMIRQLPHVRRIFARAWGVKEEDLITDFGGPVIFRPSNCTARWRTAEKWFHVDQNGLTFPGKQTIQGSVALTEQSPETGGLVVVPESWKHHSALSERGTKWWGANPNNQFLMVPPSDEILTQKQPVFVKSGSGDLILWDSRTVHCNTNSKRRVGSHQRQEEIIEVVTSPEDSLREQGPGFENEPFTLDLRNEVMEKTPYQRSKEALERLRSISSHNHFPIASDCRASELSLQRVVALVSMAPKSFASEDVIQKRRKAYVNEQTTTHWPFRFEADEPVPKQSKRDEDLNDIQRMLIG